MNLQTYFIEFSYLLASILFILGLKGLSHPETAKRGMHLAEFGMMMAIIGTLMHFEIVSYTWIIIGLLVGSTLGLAMGVWVPMTAMPQRTALSHAFGAFAAALVGIARDTGVSGYIGDGSNRWPAVHRLDAAHLFRLALEKAPAGSVLHAIADEGVPIRAIAEVIGRHLDVPVVSVPAGEASGHFGFLAGFLAADNPVSSTLTRALLGWQPAHPGLIEDLDKGHYFHGRPA